MKRTTAIVALASLFLSIVMIACAAGTAAAATPITLNTTTANLPGAPTYRLQRNITKVFDEKGKGLFQFEHYDSATLFKTDAEFGAVRDGDVDMAFLQAAFYYDNGASWINMMDTGFLYKNVDHMKAAFDPSNEVGAWLQKRIYEEFDIMTFGAFYLGARNVWLRDGNVKVDVPADLNGIKIRMPNSAGFLMLGRALGASPTPLDGNEVYLAMQTGTIDAQENITLSSYAQGQQEVCKSIVLTQHMLTPNFISVNGETWRSMTPEQQALFTELIQEAARINDQEILAEEARIIEQCHKEHGLTLQYPDRDAFRDHVLAYYLNDPGNKANWNMEMFEKINALADKF